MWSISRLLVTDRWLFRHTVPRAPFEALTTYPTPINLRARVTLACFLTNRKERTVSPCIGASIKVPPECKSPVTSGLAGCLASLLLALFLTSSEHQASARTIRVFTMLFDIVIAGAAGVRPDLPVRPGAFRLVQAMLLPTFRAHQRHLSPCTDTWRRSPYPARHGV